MEQKWKKAKVPTIPFGWIDKIQNKKTHTLYSHKRWRKNNENGTINGDDDDDFISTSFVSNYNIYICCSCWMAFILLL